MAEELKCPECNAALQQYSSTDSIGPIGWVCSKCPWQVSFAADRRRVPELEKALQPFAEAGASTRLPYVADGAVLEVAASGGPYNTQIDRAPNHELLVVGDLRRARAALEGEVKNAAVRPDVRKPRV